MNAGDGQPRQRRAGRRGEKAGDSVTLLESGPPGLEEHKGHAQQEFRNVTAESGVAGLVPGASKNWSQPISLLFTLIFVVLGCVTRFYKIGWAQKVVWDEAHFGKFASWYLNRTFYFDVHPPLGKMLLGLSGLLSGYKGDWTFESGKPYPDHVNFVPMRYFTATFGALCVPIAYRTALELGFSHSVAVLMGLLVLTDNAGIVISKFILLDPLLLFGTALSVFMLVRFHNMRRQPFSQRWWIQLVLVGTSLGFVSGIKWVGALVVALVGAFTIEELWDLWGNPKLKIARYSQHWGARIAGLVIVPSALYIFWFLLHFTVLVRSGPGDAQMPSIFQYGLVGSSISGGPLDIAYNSRVTLKNNCYNGALLHSHPSLYPEGSKQQQVTGYHHKDANNDWVVRKRRGEDVRYSKAPEFVKDGDVIRLVHHRTGRNLHSHRVQAPVTQVQYEVSGYGNETVGDAHDHWQLHIVDDLSGRKPPNLRTLTTRFRLKHVVTGCYLRMSNTFLPEWGFKQAEVTCDKRKNPSEINTVFNIENHWNDKLPPMPREHYRSRFWSDFLHLNVAMWASNQALKKDPNKEDLLISDPWMWPTMYQGLRMCSWGEKDIKYYMMGNPLSWWGGSLAILGYSIFLLVYNARHKRGMTDLGHDQWEYFKYVGKLALGGWCIHYFPFFMAGRVTYLHHYFPALYFSFIMTAFMFEHARAYLFPKYRQLWYVMLLSYGILVSASFFYFSPMTYGFDVPAEEMASRGWLQNWNIASDR